MHMAMRNDATDTPQVYVSAYALCVRDGQMLLARIELPTRPASIVAASRVIRPICL